MSESINVEQLTPLDLLMPNTYIQVLLTFKTKEPTLVIQSTLQQSLNAVIAQLPWLGGQICLTAAPAGKEAMGIRWDTDVRVPIIIDRGSVDSSYEDLNSQGMNPQSIPSEVWPLGAQPLQDPAADGTPVLAASIFRFAGDEGLGLCICAHHHAFDATGLAEMIRLWAMATAGTPSPGYPSGPSRLDRLNKVLHDDLEAVSTQSIEELWASHPEFSRSPPAMPSEFASSTSKLLSVSMEKIEELKQRIADYATYRPTTTNIVTAMLWLAVTRARAKRIPALANETTRLVSAVNSRRRIGLDSDTIYGSYFGNMVQYAMAELSISELQVIEVMPETLAPCLAQVCSIISKSQDIGHINSRSVAELCSLVDRTEDHRSIFPGWDLFSSRDLTVTSWNGLDIYSLDFGRSLGKPQHIRLPYMEADGVGMILPRTKLSQNGINEKPGVEVIIMLRKEDMAAMLEDAVWVWFTS